MAMVADCPVALTRLGFSVLAGWGEQDFDTALAEGQLSMTEHGERVKAATNAATSDGSINRLIAAGSSITFWMTSSSDRPRVRA